MKATRCLALAVAVSTSLVACGGSKSEPADVTITWSDVKQPIQGFGASAAFFGGNISEAQADQLFDAKKGIGLTMLRIMIGPPADTQADGSEPTTGAKPIPTAPELATAQQAIARGCMVWAAAWTPPPIWKTTNNKNGSGPDFPSNALQMEHYQDYANYLAQFLDMASAAKPPVPILALSPANEPDYVATWDNAQWTGAELTTFIGQYLGPTLAARYPAVKIVAPETANCPDCDKYVTPLLADQTASLYVPIIAAHGYGPPTASYDKPRKNGKAFWETEWSQENKSETGDTPDPTMTSAIDMAKHIHGDMVTTGMNAWNWWAIYITSNGLNDNKRLNPAFIQPDATFSLPYMFKRGYAFGNWSKFVRPGFVRIGATDRPKAGVLVEAYRDPTHLAIIAINTTDATVTQSFLLKGGTLGTLTPWVTSNDDSLAAKDTISATDSFSYDLPAKSVVTFVNWDATTETPGQPNIPIVMPPPPPPPDGGTDAATDAPAADAPPKPSTGLDCTAPLVPSNGVSGGVTDFTDWKVSSGRWGDNQGLYGAVYGSAGTKGSKMAVNVDTTAVALHALGSAVPNDFANAGLVFGVCTTVASFSQVQFTVAGSAPGCDLALQIKTFDQQASNQLPAGGCAPTNPAGCGNFPTAKRVAVPSAAPQTVVTPLSAFSNWSPENAAQVIGLQWQFTPSIPGATDNDGGATDGAAPPADAGSPSTCPIDVTITGIKFLP